jgi:molecular chaperone HtpG
MQFLHANNSNYYGKAQELRGAIAGWLNYIPATFLSYTKHTIEHSEEIISQMSKLLFVDEDPKRPVLRDLSSVEAYILVAAAYLHDAGMTVSDSEKRTILESAEWREWVENGSGATRFRNVASFREDRSGRMDATTRTFLADVQLRFLIAEYVRRTHHLRGGDILAMYQSEMGRFGYDDPILIQTIASVCVAHGLQQNELNDPERFPERRDVQDEKVNVRLLAVLLRLGDLLDMSYDRACPLLLNAASPIPADSLAHWTQYQRITHKMVAHDRIELIAACENEEEHRFLHDWCAWLVAELDQARRLMVRATRHAEWEPPMASIDQATGNTITIKPAKGARYIPARWRFELDTKAIFDRLIYDALDTPWDFLRELIQNAADASRCQMFADIVDRGGEAPSYPTQVEEKIRERYSIRVTLGTTEVRNEMSGEMEQRQVLTVEDEGLGMDQDVVQRYLLQVGRSYYTTRDFRDTFGFVASSRFGIGFLSVFGVSDDVTIETFKPSSTIDSEPLKLRLTGPRSYLLTEKGTRRRPGTSIQVVLRDPVEQGKITDLIENWCKRLEFPMLVNDLGKKKQFHAECAADFITEVSSVKDATAKLMIRAFPVNREGIEGELFVLSYVASGIERWDVGGTINYQNSSRLRGTRIEMPDDEILFHGINTSFSDDDEGGHESNDPFRKRIDLRGERFSPSLARNRSRFNEYFPEIDSRWQEIIREHFDSLGDLGETPLWMYKQKLSEYIGSAEFWDIEPSMMPIIENGICKSVTEDSVKSLPSLCVYVEKKYRAPAFFDIEEDNVEPELPLPIVEGIILSDNNLGKVSHDCRISLFSNRVLTKIEIISDFIICTWTLGEPNAADVYRGIGIQEIDFNPDIAACRIGSPISHYGSPHVVLNSSHPFGAWHSRVRNACDDGQFGLDKRILRSINDAIRGHALRNNHPDEHELKEKLLEWSELPGLPENLIPPFTEVNAQNFPIIGFAR